MLTRVDMKDDSVGGGGLLLGWRIEERWRLNAMSHASVPLGVCSLSRSRSRHTRKIIDDGKFELSFQELDDSSCLAWMMGGVVWCSMGTNGLITGITGRRCGGSWQKPGRS